jgi:cell division protein FtsL
MMKSVTLVWILLAVVVAGTLFRVSCRVEHLQKHLAAVNRQIVQEQENIRVLDAEWAYLNQPSRLEALAHKYLGMAHTTAVQIVTLDQVPNKPVVPQTAAVQAAAKKPAPAAQPALPAHAVILASLKTAHD